MPRISEEFNLPKEGHPASSKKKYSYYLANIGNRSISFSSIPPEYKTKELCLKYLSWWKWAEGLIHCIPDELKNSEFFLELIKICPEYLYDIPVEHLTYEICLQAVISRGHCLKDVPEHFYTLELFEEAVRTDGSALAYVPMESRTLDLCLKAFGKNPTALQYFPEEYRTRERYIEAVSRASHFIVQIDKKHFPVKDWPLDWFFYIGNVELRREFIKEHGAKIFDQLDGLRVIDEDDEYTLIRFKYMDVQDGFAKALLYRCPSSNDIYFTPVDSQIVFLGEAIKFLNNGIRKEELEYES